MLNPKTASTLVFVFHEKYSVSNYSKELMFRVWLIKDLENDWKTIYERLGEEMSDTVMCSICITFFHEKILLLIA